MPRTIFVMLSCCSTTLTCRSWNQTYPPMDPKTNDWLRIMKLPCINTTVSKYALIRKSMCVVYQTSGKWNVNASHAWWGIIDWDVYVSCFLRISLNFGMNASLLVGSHCVRWTTVGRFVALGINLWLEWANMVASSQVDFIRMLVTWNRPGDVFVAGYFLTQRGLSYFFHLPAATQN